MITGHPVGQGPQQESQDEETVVGGGDCQVYSNLAGFISGLCDAWCVEDLTQACPTCRCWGGGLLAYDFL